MRVGDSELKTLSLSTTGYGEMKSQSLYTTCFGKLKSHPFMLLYTGFKSP